ncbi:peptide-methionine (S)-S-oxide reductase MsrA [Sphingobium rhizovicinum]|uniref:Peptide methionine sulfoxide reductase MsrA n=1 Tax=Sphingobium rhizovicinum TaxID=432308 RepID=A0ABV7NKP4_9SPHN
MSYRKLTIGIAAAALTIAGTALWNWSDLATAATPAAVGIPAPSLDTPNPAKSDTAIFAGGCFWGVQGVFQHVKGVRSAVSGYSGGSRENARYERVGSGNTGHAEAVRINYDPTQISYGALLRIYFSVVADPTTLNYQGPDHGTQYRTAIFPLSSSQKALAQSYIAQLGKSGAWKRPIVTRVEPYKGFYPAEAYHQDYLARNPGAFYIRANDLPKVTALKANFPTLYRAKPVLVKG